MERDRDGERGRESERERGRERGRERESEITREGWREIETGRDGREMERGERKRER